MKMLKQSISAINVPKGIISFAAVLMAISVLADSSLAKEEPLRSKLDDPILFTKRGNQPATGRVVVAEGPVGDLPGVKQVSL